MNERQTKLLLLYEANLLSRKNILKLITIDPELKHITHFLEADFLHYCHYTPSSARKIYHWLKSKPFEKVGDYSHSGVHALTIFDAGYPSSLKHIPDPPIVLYLKGNPHLLSHIQSLSVVGTRKPSLEAKEKMESVLVPLIKNGWLIVSGMAKGIDSIAHYLALREKGSTIAVLGSGLDYVYPPENKSLFKRLSDEQLVITEYPPMTPPRRYFFPERNRLISGLGFATLVVEAEEKSGSLITADQALEQGKDVFAFPGSLLSPQAQGVNKLIKQGAKLITCSEDITEEWRPQPNSVILE